MVHPPFMLLPETKALVERAGAVVGCGWLGDVVVASSWGTTGLSVSVGGKSEVSGSFSSGFGTAGSSFAATTTVSGSGVSSFWGDGKIPNVSEEFPPGRAKTRDDVRLKTTTTIRKEDARN